MIARVTCGVLYKKAKQEALLLERPDLSFSFGFAAGEAEKIYLGACIGAMFRPREDFQPVLSVFLSRLCIIYSLNSGRDRDELWLFAQTVEASDLFEKMKNCVFNSPDYHSIRAKLCGIPESEIDLEFHKRYDKRTSRI